MNRPPLFRIAPSLVALGLSVSASALWAAGASSRAEALLARLVAPPVSTAAAANRWLAGQDVAQLPVKTELRTLEERFMSRRPPPGTQLAAKKGPGLASVDSGLLAEASERLRLTMQWAQERASFRQRKRALVKQRDGRLARCPGGRTAAERDPACAGSILDAARQEAIKLTDEYLERAGARWRQCQALLRRVIARRAAVAPAGAAPWSDLDGLNAALLNEFKWLVELSAQLAEDGAETLAEFQISPEPGPSGRSPNR